jgi:hypothetical protein
MLVSSRDRHLAQVTVAKGIERKAAYGQIQGHYELLDLYRQLYTYVISTSPSYWDLEYFERLIFVAPSAQVCFSKLLTTYDFVLRG